MQCAQPIIYKYKKSFNYRKIKIFKNMVYVKYVDRWKPRSDKLEIFMEINYIYPNLPDYYKFRILDYIVEAFNNEK